MEHKRTNHLIKLVGRLTVGLSFTLLAIGPAVASDSWTLLSSSGGRAESSSLVMEFSLGQPVTGLFGSDTPQLSAGFLQSFGPSSCCLGDAGDFDGSGNPIPDIADLVGFVEWIFADGEPPICYAEANIDGDPAGVADIADVVRLVDFMFFSGAAPEACR